MDNILPKPNKKMDQSFRVGKTTINPEKVRRQVKKGKTSKELAKSLSEAVKNGFFSE